MNTYTYDSANRLVSFNGTMSYAYNGLGDRLAQTVNAQTTNYTLDLNTGLTQVLNDGTNTYLYGNGRIAQTGSTTEYFLGDALNSVRQLTDASGDITLTKSYAPYGEATMSAGNGTSPFAYTGEQADVSGLTYLRARYYSSGDGRFLTRDTWMGDYNNPLSLNRWMYVEGNPVNYADPTGNRKLCAIPGAWDQASVITRVDEAERNVYRTSDPMDTYVAAGIAIQCAGNDNPFSQYSGNGIAQITQKQAETEWGKVIKDKWGDIRGYGLRLRCPDGELEEPLDPKDNKDAAILMQRELQLVIDECKGCTETDIYIAAGLAQNGPGFNKVNMKNGVEILRPKVTCSICISRDWYKWFRDGQPKNNQDQLRKFNLVITELIRRRWIVPALDWVTLNDLPNVKATGAGQ